MPNEKSETATNIGVWLDGAIWSKCPLCEGSGLVWMMPDGHEIECQECEGAGELENENAE